MTTSPSRSLPTFELQVAALHAGTDLSPQQIGGRLGLHARTVENIAYQAYRVLGCRTRQALRSVMLTYELAPVGGAR